MNTTPYARANWRKSSRSNGSGDCVEVASVHDGQRLVRDSKDPAGAILAFAPEVWTAFTGSLKIGKFTT